MAIISYNRGLFFWRYISGITLNFNSLSPLACLIIVRQPFYTRCDALGKGQNTHPFPLRRPGNWTHLPGDGGVIFKKKIFGNYPRVVHFCPKSINFKNYTSIFRLYSNATTTSIVHCVDPRFFDGANGLLRRKQAEAGFCLDGPLTNGSFTKNDE